MFFSYLLFQIQSLENSTLSNVTEYFSKENYYVYKQPGEFSFILPAGRYRISCYGAQGGRAYNNGNFGNPGGNGAYVSGYLNVTGNNTKFFARVGGAGNMRNTGIATGGYNGGGTSGWCIKWKHHWKSHQNKNGPGGGGGATDIRINTNDLSSRIMVAAGGSGASVYINGAPGGELTGYNAFGPTSQTTQTNGNPNGLGSDGANAKLCPSSGGGGGYRGGVGGTPSNHQCDIAVSNSGSSYISGYEGCKIHPLMQFDNATMKAGVRQNNGYIQIDQVYECPENCFSCSGAKQCKICDPPYLLLDGLCHSSCPPQTISRITYCEKCDPSCESCDNVAINCTSCFDGFYHYKDQCLESCPSGTYKLDEECFDKCPDGTFEKGSICDICDSTCGKCKENPIKCTGCPKGQYLFNHKCLDKCPDRTFRDGNECVTECKQEQFLYDGICYDKCPAGTYSKGILCEKCDSSCKECIIDAESCTNCNDDFFLFNFKCIEKCPEDYYTYKNSCLMNCPNSTFINENKCVDECPEGKFYVDNKCENCDKSCTSCQNSSTFCISCSFDRYLYNNQCLTNCINGTVIFQNECVDECPSGSYLDRNICQIPIEYYGIVEITNKKPKISNGATIASLIILVALFVAEIGFVVWYYFGDKIKSVFKSFFKRFQEKSEDQEE